MFSLQEYQHVQLLWFKKRSFTLVWKPNPPTFALVRTRRVTAQWARAAPALHTRRFCAASTHAVWNGCKPGSTEALALKAPLFTWSVKSFSCYNVLRLAALAVWRAAQTMHWHKCDHVKFLLAHSQKMVANATSEFWGFFCDWLCTFKNIYFYNYSLHFFLKINKNF